MYFIFMCVNQNDLKARTELFNLPHEIIMSPEDDSSETLLSDRVIR